MENTDTAPEWREVVGWPYAINSAGQIKRTKPASGAKVGRLLKPVLDPDGYYQVCLSENSVKQTVKVHQLVCTAFNGARPSPSHEVRHLNGCATDNRASNLKWGTPLDNTADKVLHGTVARGTRNGSAILTEENVRAIRAMRGIGIRLKTIAAHYGIDPSTVSDIARRKSWAWLE